MLMKQSKMQFQEIQISSLDNGCPEQLQIRKGFTPFTHENTTRIKKVAIITAILSIVGSYSDSLVDYYTIGELTWRVNIIGMIVAIIVYCISLIFSYGCDLQKESDETL